MRINTLKSKHQLSYLKQVDKLIITIIPFTFYKPDFWKINLTQTQINQYINRLSRRLHKKIEKDSLAIFLAIKQLNYNFKLVFRYNMSAGHFLLTFKLSGNRFRKEEIRRRKTKLIFRICLGLIRQKLILFS